MKSNKAPLHPAAWRKGHGNPRLPLPVRQRLIRLLLRRRRLVAALLLCTAASLAVHQLTPAGPVTELVLVASRDLPAGHTLSPTDLLPLRIAPHAVPDGSLASLSTDLWLGSQVSSPVRRGQVMTDAALLGKELLIGAPPGSQAVPLRLSDASIVQLLRPGQLVNVVLSSADSVDGPHKEKLLAKGVAVLWTPELAKTTGGLLPMQDTDGLVVVAATPSQAQLLAGASARGKVFLVLL